jgi:hypothetical protein
VCISIDVMYHAHGQSPDLVFIFACINKKFSWQISLTGREENNCQEKIESQEGLAELSSSDVLQNINRLYGNACTAEKERVKVNQAEILCWRNFIIGLDNSVDEIMIKEKVGTKKAKGLIYDLLLHIILTSNEKPYINASVEPERFMSFSKK